MLNVTRLLNCSGQGNAEGCKQTGHASLGDEDTVGVQTQGRGRGGGGGHRGRATSQAPGLRHFDAAQHVQKERQRLR